ncbi:MAG: transcription antitermination factor NusB [Oligoflexia bacterium]|nr:transcription antitermination factor NusB [Oligoflexia bacterium]
MASRRRAREFALQALYQSDLAELPVRQSLAQVWAEQLDGGLQGRAAESDEIEFAQRLAFGTEQRRTELDALIDGASANWRLVRMPVVDRNILRLAAYELLACQDIPVSVSINEAVELAKRFGDKDSRAFVNGILDRIAFETGRGGRRHRG